MQCGKTRRDAAACSAVWVPQRACRNKARPQSSHKARPQCSRWGQAAVRVGAPRPRPRRGSRHDAQRPHAAAVARTPPRRPSPGPAGAGPAAPARRATAWGRGRQRAIRVGCSLAAELKEARGAEARRGPRCGGRRSWFDLPGRRGRLVRAGSSGPRKLGAVSCPSRNQSVYGWAAGVGPGGEGGAGFLASCGLRASPPLALMTRMMWADIGDRAGNILVPATRVWAQDHNAPPQYLGGR